MAWINLADKPEGKVIDKNTHIGIVSCDGEPIDDMLRHMLLQHLDPRIKGSLGTYKLSDFEYLDETVPTYGYSREQVNDIWFKALDYAHKRDTGETMLLPMQELIRVLSTIPALQQEQDGWVSVKDKLPEYGKYLTYNGNAIGYAWYDSKRGWYDKSTPEDWEILFYHLLPPPPKQ